MKVSKRSTYNPEEVKKDPSSYLKKIDLDIQDIMTAFQGRIRFGTSTNGYRGQNVSGEFHRKADTGNADTQFSVTHTLGIVPTDYIVTYISKGGVVYDSGTTWTTTTIYLKCTAANAAVNIFILK